jgi:hypothetical protein
MQALLLKPRLYTSAIATPSSIVRTVIPLRQNQFSINSRRTMASTTAATQEWLVIAPDHEGALQKRLAVRDEHLAGLKKDAEGWWLWGGKSSIPS